MKKFFAMMLALVMVLSLAACGGKTSAPEQPAPEQPAPEAPAEDWSKWPEENVTIYVGASAGGQVDLMARIVAAKMQEITGKAFTVVNDGTASGTVAGDTVRNAKPDGYTLYSMSVSQNCKMVTGVWDATMDDFTWLSYYNDPGIESAVICVRNDSPFQTIEELIAYAKDHPGELQTGVTVGGAAHLVEILTDQQFGIEIEYLEAGNNGDRTPKFLGGQFDLMMAATSYLKPYVDSGDLRPLAVTGAQRSAFYPDVPCMVDLGYEATEQPMVYWVAGPAGMPEGLVARFEELMKEVMESKDVQEQFAGMNFIAKYTTSAETDAMVRSVADSYTEAYSILAG